MTAIVWSERVIARAIALQTLAPKCVVLVDNCNWTGYEVRCARRYDGPAHHRRRVKISPRRPESRTPRKISERILQFRRPSELKEIRDGNGVLRYTTRESLWNNVARQRRQRSGSTTPCRATSGSRYFANVAQPAKRRDLMREQHGNDTVAVAEVVRRNASQGRVPPKARAGNGHRATGEPSHVGGLSTRHRRRPPRGGGGMKAILATS